MKKLCSIIFTMYAFNVVAQNVGIGTTTPTYPLTVIADNTYKGITQKSGTVEVGFFTSPLAASLQTWSPHNLNFATGGGFARMTIVHPSGFIGVGTTTPAGSFHVKRNTSTDATYSTAQFQGTTFSSYFHLGVDESTSINGGKATSSVFINPQSTGGVYLSQTGGGVSIGGGLVPNGALDVIRSGNYTAQFFGTNNSSYFNQGAYENTEINGGKPTSTVTINSASSGNVIIATGGGNVGIGSINPSSKLHVTREASNSVLYSTARFEGTSFSSYFNVGANEATYINGGKAASSVFINQLQTGGVYLSQAGGGVNIGGALAPAGALDVNRSGNYTAQFFGTNNSSYFNFGANETLILDGGKTTSSVTINSNSSGNVYLAAGGGNVYTVTGGGNLAVGPIATPLATLSVVRGTGANGTAEFKGTTYSSHFNYSTEETTFIRGGKATSQVLINDANTGNVRLAEGGGNVGIGVAIPTAKLEVGGQIKINGGSPGAGKVLTSDANGLATWASKSAGDGFKALNNSALTLSSNTSNTVPFVASNSNGAFNDGGNFNNPTSAYVAPLDGVYQFNTTLSLNLGTAPAGGLIQLIPIGTGIAENLGTSEIAFNALDKYPVTISHSFITKMKAGDTVKITVAIIGGGSISFPILNSQFTGVRLY